MKLLIRIIYYAYSIVEMVFGFKGFGKIVKIFLSKKMNEVHNIQLKNFPISFYLRGKMDLWALKETWLDKFYERQGIVIEDGWHVIDIGAGYGDFCIRSAYSKPNSSIYAFEPFPESYKLLIRNVEVNKIENISTFPLAVWSKTGEIVLDLTNGEPLQFATIEESDKLINRDKTKKVQAISLADFLHRNGITKIDLMKIDCEGAEYEILSGCEPEALSKIERITMEYHNGVQGQTHDELVKLLSAHDFKVTCEENIVHDNIGYLYAIRNISADTPQ